LTVKHNCERINLAMRRVEKKKAEKMAREVRNI
jgi:hypothetical protein